jgi:Na+/H+-dicarboxylate symporter
MSHELHHIGQILTKRILIAMFAGATFGSVLVWVGLMDNAIVSDWIIGGLFALIGKIFISSLQMLVVPLVLVSLVCGTSSLADPKKLGRVGGKALVLYLFTTGIAISLAMAAALIFKPGAGADMPQTGFDAKEAPPIIDTLTNIVPTNPIAAMAEGNMLQIIVFAILLGIALTFSGDAGKRIREVFDDLNTVVMRLVIMVMWIAPFGVFALMTDLFATTSWTTIGTLGLYFGLVIAVLLVHALLVYPTLLLLLGGLNPWRFLRKMRPVQLFAFSTASSNATLPITLSTTQNRLGVGKGTSSFVVPLGATINMDGTAIMQGVATVFIAQVYAIDLSMGQLLTVVLMAVMASIGAAGVPGVGLILLATVLTQVGLPVEGIALIIGVDRILDMTRTAVNVTGDATVATLVGKSEGDLDESVFNDPNADIEGKAHYESAVD